MIQDIEFEIIDSLIEKPYQFMLAGKVFALYPKTLGKMKRLIPVYKLLEANVENIMSNSDLEALRLCREKPDVVCLIISYETFNSKKAILNDLAVKNRAKFLKKHLSDEDMATLLVMSLADNNKIKRYQDYLGITKDLELKQKIAKLKNNADCVSVGGGCIYGTLIDFACSRYGWDLNYILWGISYVNLQMLYSDQIVTVSLSKEERRRLCIFDDKEVINADDPKNSELIKQMLSE